MTQTIFEVDTNLIKDILTRRMGYKDFSNPFINKVTIKRAGSTKGLKSLSIEKNRVCN